MECLGFEDGALDADRALVPVIEAALTRQGCTVLLTHALHTGNDHYHAVDGTPVWSRRHGTDELPDHYSALWRLPCSSHVRSPPA
ncbi:hypothetical protein [Kitasatospora sp. McL0602]|uniref:hypothetical protein n=1 Tax=Kitasatospora sp. McL0602 TaxID=3439530 RepID=UPI003F8C3293